MGEICTGDWYKIDRRLERGLMCSEAHVEMPLKEYGDLGFRRRVLNLEFVERMYCTGWRVFNTKLGKWARTIRSLKLCLLRLL